MRPIDRPWYVPYCEDCQKHVDLAWQTGGKFFRKAALIGAGCLVPFAPFHPLFLIVLVLDGAILAVFYAISRMRMKAIKIGPSCVSPTLAVRRKGPMGDRYAIKMLNLRFSEAFDASREPASRGAASLS